jgi:hypothetical protein
LKHEIKIFSEPLTAAEKLATLSVSGERVDQYTKVSQSTSKVDGTNYKIYNWGKSNMLPVEMLEIAQSNGDVLNLLSTKKDFIFGNGLALLKYTDGVTEPEDLTNNSKVKKAILESGITDTVLGIVSNYVNCATAPVNVSFDKGLTTIKDIDSLTHRAAQVESLGNGITTYLISADWKNNKSKKIPIPAFDFAKREKLKESIYVIKPKQTGQFYYGYPDWWAAMEWIKIANKISAYYNDSMASEGNLGHLVRVSEDALREMATGAGINPATEETYTTDEYKPILEKAMETFLFEEAKKKKIIDYCGVMPNGQLIHGVEFEPIKKSYTGKEYTELQTVAVNYIAGSMQVLGGLSGVSDGKFNSGGGTEIRVSAEYQQFYRTKRDRQPILDFLNLVYLPSFKKLAGIPESDNVWFEFKNIHLQSIDDNKNGVTTKIPA